MKLLVLIMALCAVAQAQPAPPAGPAPAPKKAPAPPAPQPPYAAPGDPYADPTPDPKAKADGKTDAKAAPKTDPKAPKAAPVDPYAAAPSDAPGIPSRVGLSDLPAVQGLLAVQRLDGWLLYDRDGSNPIAVRLVAPDGHLQRAWFYMIPARGEPVALVPVSEQRLFEKLPGKKLAYLGYRDLGTQLAALLKGVKSIAIEYSPKASVPNISRVDAGTVELLRAAGVTVRSSDTLVQYTKAIWGDAGRAAHYVAVHHLVELRKDALAFITQRLVAHPQAVHDGARARRAAAGRRGGREHRRSVLRADRGEDRADQHRRRDRARHRGQARQARGHLRRADVGRVRRQDGARVDREGVQHGVARARSGARVDRGPRAQAATGHRRRRGRCDARVLQEGLGQRAGHAPHRPLDRQRSAGRRRLPRRLRGQGHADPDAGHRLHRRAGPLLPW